MNWIVWLIIACEIGFWVFISLGLTTRYVFKKKKLGLVFLALTPVVDLVLLIVTSYDLYRGAVATTAHGIAAVYLGFSLAFGKSLIQKTDELFQYYVMKTGPKPIKLYGVEYAKNYLRNWLRHLVAYIFGASLIGIIYLIVNDLERIHTMLRILSFWTTFLVVNLLICTSYFICPKRNKIT